MRDLLTPAQVSDVRRYIACMRDIGDHPRADYWEARLDAGMELDEAMSAPPERETSAWLPHLERVACSLCSEMPTPGSRWCEAHRPDFEAAA